MIDHGEAETIAFALENEIEVVIPDDKDARKVARSFGLRATGTLGLFLLAKRKGLIFKSLPTWKS